MSSRLARATQWDPGSTRKEQWKKEWGNLNDVSFNNESIQGDGKYVVSVNDSKTTKVVQRYVVDTVTGVVEEK